MSQSDKTTYHRAGDKPACSSCGMEMRQIRHSLNFGGPQVQTFSCLACHEEITRIVDGSGNPYK